MSPNRSLGTLSAFLLVITVILAIAPGALAQNKYKTLHKFENFTRGQSPMAGVIFDKAGNLYGTTSGGGNLGCGGPGGCGLVFRLTPNQNGSWKESVLYSFCSLTNCADGFDPEAGLIIDQEGNLYGTTWGGGTPGAGVIFKLSQNSGGGWTESVVYNFCSVSNCSDGVDPAAGLIFDAAGNLYGTTWHGGVHELGVVFKLTRHSGGKWTEAVLHGFTGSDGMFPAASLILDAAGNLYGTTFGGGSRNCVNGCGVAFELTPTSNGSWKEKVLHRFTGGKDGFLPFGGLILDGAGNLYGTANEGGEDKCGPYSCGLVFQLTPNARGKWKKTVVHYFTGGKDGGYPVSGLILDAAGNLYGTTQSGGNLNYCNGFGCGVVFKLTPGSNGGWKETALHAFENHPGFDPWGGLIFDQAGNLYGTTYGGDGFTSFGSVFEIAP
jgi:uncharacterized repeat protein (TIGR03803 family)